MHPYKVIYLDSTFVNKRKDQPGYLDGLTTSKELEALLIEQDQNGYELFSIVPIVGNTTPIKYVMTDETVGFMVTFKRKPEK
jgi:hypothetical protein